MKKIWQSIKENNKIICSAIWIMLSILSPIFIPLLMRLVKYNWLDTCFDNLPHITYFNTVTIVSGAVLLLWTNARYRQAQKQLAQSKEQLAQSEKQNKEQLAQSKEQFLINELNARMLEVIKLLSNEEQRKRKNQTARNIINTVYSSVENNYSHEEDKKRIYTSLFQFSGMDLSNANLNGVQLPYANLQNTQLQSTNLESADLGNANLVNTDLRNANLRSAKLQSAKLQSADLEKADLSGANLQGAKINQKSKEYIVQQAVAHYDEIIWLDDKGQKIQLS